MVKKHREENVLPEDRSLLYHHVSLLYQDRPGKIENSKGHETAEDLSSKTYCQKAFLKINLLPSLHSQSLCRLSSYLLS